MKIAYYRYKKEGPKKSRSSRTKNLKSRIVTSEREERKKKKMSILQNKSSAGASARVLWGSSAASAGAGRKIVQDQTWGLSYTHYSPVATDFLIKSGSKRMILSTSSSGRDSLGPQSPNKSKISEDQLLRKYR